MAREFKEETGVEIPRHRWISLGDISVPGGAVYIYYTVDQFAYDNAHTTTEERVERIPVDKLCNFLHVSNLSWLIPAALDHYNNSGFRLGAIYQ